MSEWKFKRDTAFRKQFFVPDSFAHPAKMDAQLLIKIIEEYTKLGEVILDPMAGSGTTMLACTLGRNCVLVELEDKFCKMMADNWEEVKMRPQLGSAMGGCQIIKGDARLLSGLLVDKCIFSPPCAEAQEGAGIAKKGYQGPKHGPTDLVGKRSYMPENIGNSEGQIGNLPYGQIDKIVTSPPYEAGTSGPSRSPFWDRLANDPTSARYGRKKHPSVGQGYDTVDSIITSPPYENQLHKGSGEWSKSPEGRLLGGKQSQGGKMLGVPQGEDYIKSQDNIGNLKSDSYLEAMLHVYQQCHKVLKPQGLMILVTKNFIRNKQVVRLDEDTLQLCGKVGFIYIERHCRKLPAQSFWRTLYHQKHPEVEQINHEDILVFKKLI